MPKAKPYLIVVVNTNRTYDVFGNPNLKTRVLAERLKKLGVNESVEPGRYKFTIERKGLREIAHFYPTTEEI